MRIRPLLPKTLAVALGSVALACQKDKQEQFAPAVASLESAPPKSPAALRFVVEQSSSRIDFLMDAPLEKIHGQVVGGVSGYLSVDPEDITKTTGLLRVDLDKLVLFQQKRDDEQAEYGERIKSDLQNRHMRTWLEISPDAPPDVREDNRVAQFKITGAETQSAVNVALGTDKAHKVTVTAIGQLGLHGRSTTHKVKVEVTFSKARGAAASLSAATVEPLVISLDAHDVRPRDAFGRLAKKSLEALGSKVASEVPVNLSLTARTVRGAGESIPRP